MSVRERRSLSRREFLRYGALGAGATILAACQPKVIKEVVKETVVVQGTPQVVEKAVTATPAPKGRVAMHATSSFALECYTPAHGMIKEQYPHIDFTLDQTPMGSGWDQYADNIMTRIAGGESLDITYIAIEGLALLADTNILRPLDPFLEADAEAKKDVEADIHPTLLRIFQWRGRQVAMPYGWNNMMMYFNPVIFEKKGVDRPTKDWTWNDFLQICLKIADVKGGKDDLYAYSFWDGSFGMAPWYFNNDTSPLKNNWADSNLDDPKVAETLQFLADLILNHKVAPNPAGWDEWGQFFSRHLAMMSCGGWCIGAAKNAEFSDYSFQYYPHRAGRLKTVVGVGGWGINTVTRNPDEAWQVLKILNSFEVEMQCVKVDGSPPARRSVAESPEWKNLAAPSSADMAIVYESLDYADVVPSPPNFNVVDPLLKRWYAQIWNGELGVVEALKGAHQELQAEMDKIKKA